MKKMHLRLLSLLLVLALLGGFAVPTATAARIRPVLMTELTPEPTPEADYSYTYEVLQYLTANANYRVQGGSYQADGAGKIPLEEAWFGTTVSIVKVGDNATTSDSAAQSLDIPARTAPPTGVGVVHASGAGKSDGKITGVGWGMEWRKEGQTSWTRCTFSTEIGNLSAGIYYVRAGSMNGMRFASLPVTVEILEGEPESCQLEVTAPTFDAVTAGYPQPEPKAITIRNTGTVDAAITSVTLSGENPDSFTISGGDNTAVPANGSNTSYSVCPKGELPAGTYSARIVVAYNDGKTAEADVSFVVNAPVDPEPTDPPPIEDPKAPKNLEELRAADPKEVAKLSKFDGRSYRIITPVRDQGDSNLCWAYASINASEASVLREGFDPAATLENLRFSPNYLGYIRFNRGADLLGNEYVFDDDRATDWRMASGDPGYSTALFAQWWGPAEEGTPLERSLSNAEAHSHYRLEHAIHIPGDFKTDAEARTQLKQAIAQYGAVTFSYNWVGEFQYDNPSRGGFGNPHACTIIGWDDTIPASQFHQGASQDGGWLVKNSYSTLPYFYLSYDNSSAYAYAFDYTAKEDYDFNYYYDGADTDFGMSQSLNITRAANVFQGLKGTETETEYVKAVQVAYMGTKATTCQVQVYTNLEDQQDMTSKYNTNPILGTLAATGTATFDRQGYHTVPLEQMAEIEPGSYFSIVVTISGEGSYLRLVTADAKSYSSSDGSTWGYMRYRAPRIKAYTVLESGSAALTPEPTPNAAIDFTAETLTGLVPGAGYLVNRAALTADETGALAMDEAWLGTAISIVKQGDQIATTDSAPQTLEIPARPMAPTGVQGVNETFAGEHDGKLTGLATTMAYRALQAEQWIPCPGAEVTGLTPGTYEIRFQATESSFASPATQVTIAAGPERIYTLAVTAPTFDDVVVGYEQPQAKAIRIQNTGNSDVEISGVALSSLDAFTLTQGTATVAVGQTNETYLVQPNAGLAAGSYQATVTVTYHNGKEATAELHFTVSAAEDDEAVRRVEALIDDIGPVDKNSGPAIEAARAAYEALTDSQKQQVRNYQTLLDAEEAFQMYKLLAAAEEAQRLADEARQKAEEAKQAAEKARDEAKQAAESSAENKEAAEEAARKAKESEDNAKKAEEAAQKAAGAAQKAAEAAETSNKEAAEKALAAAQEANRAAEEANRAATEAGKAAEAQRLAQEAREAAEEAAKTAKAAEDKAEEARQKAEEAANSAAEDKEAAEKAKQEAQEAQEAAEKARDAAKDAEKAADAAKEAADQSKLEAAASAAEAAGYAEEVARMYNEIVQMKAEMVELLAKAQKAAEKAEEERKAAEAAALAAAKYEALIQLSQVDLTGCTPEQEAAAKAILAKAREAIQAAETRDAVASILAETLKAVADAKTQQGSPADAFQDVKKDTWYYPGVDYMVRKGYMKGLETDVFGVNGIMTRGQMVTILYRIAGEPSTEGMTNPFTDVAENRFYTDAVIWAASNGIVMGIKEGIFDPNGSVTRQQVATILYRFSGEKASDQDLLGNYPDGDKVSSYAREAMNWAISQGIVMGVADGGKTTLSPAATATRAQMATILQRYLEKQG